jgi:mono/diheme cytochrome c family protein
VPDGATPEMVAQGQQIFTGKGMCLTCHGPTATGTPLAPNLTDQEWLNITGEWSEIQGIVRNGVPTPKQHPSPMPPMGGAQLSDQEIQAVASYVYSVSHQGT